MSVTQSEVSVPREDFQFSEQILYTLEQSKLYSESLFDQLDQIFAIVNDELRVLRANQSFSRSLGIHAELAEGESLLQLFDEPGVRVLNRALEECRSGDPLRSKVSVEIPILARSRDNPSRIPGDGSIPYLWSIQVINIGRASDERTSGFLVLGKDISQLREQQAKLNELFSGLPLGVLTVGEEGKILGVYSNFTYTFFSQADIAAHSIQSLLFGAISSPLKAQEKDAIINCFNSVGDLQLLADLQIQTLPKQIEISRKGVLGGNCTVGMSVHPISSEGTVTKLLVLLEDKTLFASEQNSGSEFSHSDDPDVNRVREIKKHSVEMLMILVGDVRQLLDQGDSAVRARAWDGFANILHGLKGLMRIAGFQVLVEMVQNLEEYLRSLKIKDSTQGHKVGWVVGDSDYSNLAQSISEIRFEFDRYFNVLCGVFPQARESGGSGFDVPELEDILYFESLYRRHNRYKQIHLSLLHSERFRLMREWVVLDKTEVLRSLFTAHHKRNLGLTTQPVEMLVKFAIRRISADLRRAISECVLHLINNCFAHAFGKSCTQKDGKIEIKIRYRRGQVEVLVSDNGAGIDPEKIKETALKKGLVLDAHLQKMTSEQLIQLIFLPGFSTMTHVDQVSGMGVGLSAVSKRVRSLGGTLKVNSTKGSGTCFQLRMPEAKLLARHERLVTALEVLEELKNFGRVEVCHSRDIEHLGHALYTVDIHSLILYLSQKARAPLVPTHAIHFCFRLCEDGRLIVGVRRDNGIKSNRKKRIHRIEREIAEHIEKMNHFRVVREGLLASEEGFVCVFLSRTDSKA